MGVSRRAQGRICSHVSATICSRLLLVFAGFEKKSWLVPLNPEHIEEPYTLTGSPGICEALQGIRAVDACGDFGYHIAMTYCLGFKGLGLTLNTADVES